MVEPKVIGKTPTETKSGRETKTLHNILPIRTVLIDFTDGFGKNSVKIAFVIGNEVRFLEGQLSGPAQSWLSDSVRSRLDDTVEKV